ncbi:MAG TPA: protease pro-enzyme activation domain-containing protein, partial [Solirubrobacteraceae bacterium]
MGSLVVLALAVTPASALATPATTLLSHATPPPVLNGTAVALGQVAPATGFAVNLDLAPRDQAKLNSLVAAITTAGSPSFGHYLTPAQYRAQYAPTAAQVLAATTWAKAHGLTVTGVSPDNLLVYTRTTAATAEQAFAVKLDTFRANGRTFRANDRAPRVPAGLDIASVSGLSTYNVYVPALTCQVSPPAPPGRCGLDGSDFASAYDVVGDGKGQTLGFTLWGQALPQSDYTSYASATGTTALSVGSSATGDDGLNFVLVDGGDTASANVDNEIALDTEIAHGVAPGVHETYWLGQDNDTSLAHVLDDAANSSIDVISNSWGSQSSGCPTDTGEENALQMGASTGKTFYFATGDAGAAAGCSWPSESQYVVAVGGTALQPSPESAIENGGGCTNSEPRPSWQTGIGTPLLSPGGNACGGRAQPDVAADSGTGTYLFFDGHDACCTGGTSLATPIWAAATVVYNKHNANTGRPGVGFDAPLIYQLANNPTTYPHDFHDITTGTNGFAAVTGWDEATGWGSADFDKLFNNPTAITYTGPSNANHGDTISLSATLDEAGSTTPLVGSQISFATHGESCDGTTDGSGHASCNVTINDAPGHYAAIAAFAGDSVHVAKSDTEPFTVNWIATTTRYTGPTSGDYGVPVTLTASLTDDSNSTGIAGETLHISFGAE